MVTALGMALPQLSVLCREGEQCKRFGKFAKRRTHSLVHSSALVSCASCESWNAQSKECIDGDWWMDGLVLERDGFHHTR